MSCKSSLVKLSSAWRRKWHHGPRRSPSQGTGDNGAQPTLAQDSVGAFFWNAIAQGTSQFSSSRLPSDLSVEVRDREIVISKPSAGLRMTYRKAPDAPILQALDPIRGKLDR